MGLVLGGGVVGKAANFPWFPFFPFWDNTLLSSQDNSEDYGLGLILITVRKANIDSSR